MSAEFILKWSFNPLNAKLNPICHFLALLGAHHILHFSRIRVNIPFTLIKPASKIKQIYYIVLMAQTSF
jgi:hypothetical protein